MRRIDSLRFRIVMSFTLVGLVLSLLFGWFAVGMMHLVEDNYGLKRIEAEAKAFLAEYARDPQTPLPQTLLMKAYVGQDQLPEDFRDYLQSKKPGLHEMNDSWCMVVAEMPGSDQFLYLIQNNSPMEPLDGLPLTQSALLGVLFVTLLSAWLGNMLGHRMMAPLRNLAAEVRALDPSALPENLAGKYYKDEVGDVAQGLGQTLGVIAALVERERRFTGDASHELRSPVTVIKGAAELIERLSSKGKSIASPLRRIHRAVKDMENIIETFLYLGREGHQVEEGKPFLLADLIEGLVEQNRYLLEDKEVSVQQELDEQAMLQAPRKVTAIAVGNLLRNAFQYTDRGSVTITAGIDSVCIRDTGPGIDEKIRNRAGERQVRSGSGEGFGLGLSIVSDFCIRFGWELELNSDNHGTTARLIFKPL